MERSEPRHPDEPRRPDGNDFLSGNTIGQVFDASPSGMLLVSADGTVRMANLEAERLFGYARGELVGQPVERLVPERFRREHPAQRGGYFANPSARAMGAGRDLFGLRRDGSEVPIEIGLNPIRANGQTFVLAAVIDITQRKRSEDMLRASLAEKETLLREIHHRVKNNMQVISSLLNMQQSSIDDARYRALLEECQTRVRTMALIHEKLYSANKLSALDATDYVRSLMLMLFRSYQPAGSQVRVETKVDPIDLDVQTAIPVGLILHELVTNSLKHGLRGVATGLVTVELTAEAGRARLVVADDGKGLPPDFDPRATRGLGFRMIGALTRQLGGHMEFTRGPGARFSIEFEPVTDTVHQ